MASMRRRGVELLEKRGAVQDVASIPAPLAWDKKREGRAVREDGTVVRGRAADEVEGRP